MAFSFIITGIAINIAVKTRDHETAILLAQGVISVL
jgi:hypothetical protein